MIPSMETEDLIKLPASSNSGDANENDDKCESGYEAIEADSLPLNSDVKGEINGKDPGSISDDLQENLETLVTTDIEIDADNNTPSLPVGIEFTESVAVVEKLTSTGNVHPENESVAVQSESSFTYHKKDGILSSERPKAVSSLSGVKRPRITVDEPQPSVHVVYSSLTRESKQKLEELLQQWSRWHSESCSSSNFQDSNIVVESGEETYFPALRVGLDKPSAVTFWVDNQTKVQSSKEFIPLDGTTVPLYDRGFSLALTSNDGSCSLDGVDKLDTSRCFNCGSYSHALKDCPKPRDNVAVNNARKQHKSKRNQNANSRNPTRYYQSSRGGKYDGLTPGALHAETRQLLGLGEFDPPPWLNRMREIGYPLGYLDPDVEDQPSGIMIFGDEEKKEEGEEGEILDASNAEPSRKKSVEFPGVNAPVPENADKWLWAAKSSSFSHSRDRSHRRHNDSSENLSRGHYNTERRWSRDFEDDGPPGCEPGTSPSLSNHFLKYGDYDSNHSPRGSPSVPWSPNFGRSLSDRGRRSPLAQDGSPSYGQYGNYPYPSRR
ncbi:hypothetical protein BUALT_Bualt04G0127600 [Buddleja alternifolia]|uniref:CCHC-type domain-containing protein n=1 Tax=Buddleja alternifolia TaxID=168488 RepID=A0AAV6XNF7_9LAMI|nr:hypothetical protein BUALT_Bualt04G0127600 [Buddleja alternifolia]